MWEHPGAFHLVDYAEFSSPPGSGSAEPVVRKGKFVLILSGSDTYMVLAPIEKAPYHSDVVRLFCEDRGISGHMLVGGERFLIDDSTWSIAGGGKWEIRGDRRNIKLSNGSMVYGKCDFEKLEELLSGIGCRLGSYPVSLKTD